MTPESMRSHGSSEPEPIGLGGTLRNLKVIDRPTTSVWLALLTISAGIVFSVMMTMRCDAQNDALLNDAVRSNGARTLAALVSRMQEHQDQLSSTAMGWAFPPVDLDALARRIDVPNDFVLRLTDVSLPGDDTPLVRGKLTSDLAVATVPLPDVEIYGRRWHATALAGAEFAAAQHLTDPAGILCAGAAMSLMLSALMAALASYIKRSREVLFHHGLLASVAENASDAIIIESLQGVILAWNAAAERLFGWPANLAIGRPSADLPLPSDMAQQDADILSRCASGAKVAAFDTTRRHADGHPIEVTVSATPVELAGRVISIVRYIRDNSVRKALDVALRQNLTDLEGEVARRTVSLRAVEHDLRAITDALPSLIAYWDKDLINRFANEAHRRYFDTAARDTVGMRFEDCVDASRAELMVKRIVPVMRGEPISYEREVRSPATGAVVQTWQMHYLPDKVGDDVVGFYVFAHDITTLKSTQLKLAASERILEQAGAVSGVGGFQLDLRSGRQEWTRQTFKIYEIDADDAPPVADLHKLMTADDSAKLWAAIRGAGESGEGYDLELPTRTFRGRPIWIRTIGVVEFDAEGPARLVGAIQDISLRREMETKLADAACRDKLTGLANRTVFMDRLQKSVTRVRQGHQAHFAVLFLDFDRFKQINDTLGHDAGDELMRQISVRLRSVLRASDAVLTDDTGNLVSRFGGDEFLLLINDLASPQAAAAIGERLLNALSPLYDIHGSAVRSSASIGIVTSDKCQTTAEDIVRNADVAMYEAKRAGRACFVVFNDAMHIRLTRHMTIENGLRHALEAGDLFLEYQPIVDLTTGEMVSAEALVRWVHPTLGTIPPSEFIPIAEESELIIAVGQWVQKEACRAMAKWRHEDPNRAPATISVNLSRAELAIGERLLQQVRDTLTTTGLPGHCLQLEVTEREIMRNPEASRTLMMQLQSLGVKLAMDDFGTGTSSLSVLRDYPFDTIKIDRSFVQDLCTSTAVVALMHATINLIENLGMGSVAEGVEGSSQVGILQSLGCRHAQGYLFSRPVGADKLLSALHSRPRCEEAEPLHA